jgi:TolB-like protein
MFLSAVLMVAVATPKLVVAPFRAVQVSTELTAYAAEQLARTLQEKGLEVVTPQDAALLLGAAGQRLLECPGEGSPACLAELGSALGAEAVVRGVISKPAGVFTVDVKVLDVRDGKTLAAAKSETSEEWRQAAVLGAVADALVAQLKQGDGGEAAAARGPGAKLWAPVLAGVALAGGGGALLGVSFGQIGELTRAPRSGEAPLPYAAAHQQFQDAVMLRTVGITLLGLGAAVAVMGVVLSVTGPVAVVPVAGNGSAGLGVAGVF